MSHDHPGEVNGSSRAPGAVKRVDDSATDVTRMYLNDIGRRPLLTREGEAALAMRIDASRIAMLSTLFRTRTCSPIVKGWVEGVETGKVKLEAIFALRDIPLPDLADDDGVDPVFPVAADLIDEDDFATELPAEALAEMRMLIDAAVELMQPGHPVDARACALASRWISARLDAVRLDELSRPFEDLSKSIEAAGIRLGKEAVAAGADRALVLALWRNGKVKTLRGDSLSQLRVLSNACGSEVGQIDEMLDAWGMSWPDYVWARERMTQARRELTSAKNEMIASNLRLVVSIARPLANRGLGLLDLCSEGNIGLIRAVEKFDARRGFKFATYSSFWVRQAVSRALADQGRLIRVPVHTVEKAVQVRRAADILLRELGREPTLVELSEKAGVSIDTLRRIQSMTRDPVSLDAPAADGNDTTVGELVEDRASVGPEHAAALSETRRLVSSAMLRLSAREERVIRMRYGIGLSDAHTLEDCGEFFGVTRERIRQIEAKCLSKLRHHRRSSSLRELLDD
ncbi:sigma-70 family RNA polymerase sigma factor [Bosea sp. RAC05]|uniref:sigma-70 family RNA polymerase sigma factor n=1 Tax=Bosea sp. RAC05 TaxID=1842539 RepID=UPI000857C7E9|nr:sigma-70 family RNA polymerase sigma factor [Bosea sp. RAC05]AOG03069.1 RNA polymerase sigma factor, sigma-70 family protein [Bosea sp. RAC05]